MFYREHKVWRAGVTLRLAEALQRSMTFCRWLRWWRFLGGESRAGMLLSAEETELQGCGPSSPTGGATRAWSLEDPAVEVMVPKEKEVSVSSKTVAWIQTVTGEICGALFYPVCSRGVSGPGLGVAAWFGSAGVGRCRQCLEAGKLSVWTDYEPPALDS